MNYFKTSTLLVFIFLSLSFYEGKGQTEVTSKTESVKNNIIQKTYYLKGFKQSCCTGIVNYSLKEVIGFIVLYNLTV